MSRDGEKGLLTTTRLLGRAITVAANTVGETVECRANIRLSMMIDS